MSLYELGWTDDRNQELSIDRPLQESELSPARVVRQDRDRWLLDRGDGNATPAVLAGRLRHSLARAKRPVVGDWVMIPNDPTADAAVIRRVLSRRSRLARASGEGKNVEVLAANVDTTLVVCGLDRDFNLRRVERYLTLAWGGGTVPVVLLNKADVCGELDERLAAAVAAAPGARSIRSAPCRAKVSTSSHRTSCRAVPWPCSAPRAPASRPWSTGCSGTTSCPRRRCGPTTTGAATPPPAANCSGSRTGRA